MFEYPPGATPIDENEADGLLPKHLTTQADLNEWEQARTGPPVRWSVPYGSTTAWYSFTCSRMETAGMRDSGRIGCSGGPGSPR